MATNDWAIIYRTYTTEELDEEITFLKKESKNLYMSQGVGGKNYQRNVTTIQDRLRAALTAKGVTDPFPSTLADFSESIFS
jgi:ribosomal protein L29